MSGEPCQCGCLACDHESRGTRVKRLRDGSLVVFVPYGGPTFPSMPVYVEAETAGTCTRDSG